MIIDSIYGLCAQCGGTLTMDHRCPWWAKYPTTGESDIAIAREVTIRRIAELEAALREAAEMLDDAGKEISSLYGLLGMPINVTYYKRAAQKAREVVNGGS